MKQLDYDDEVTLMLITVTTISGVRVRLQCAYLVTIGAALMEELEYQFIVVSTTFPFCFWV